MPGSATGRASGGELFSGGEAHPELGGEKTVGGYEEASIRPGLRVTGLASEGEERRDPVTGGVNCFACDDFVVVDVAKKGIVAGGEPSSVGGGMRTGS